MASPCTSVCKFATASSRATGAEVSGTLFHCGLDGLKQCCGVAVRAGGSGLVSIAFVVSIIRVGAVSKGTRVGIWLGLDLRGDVVVEIDGRISCDDDRCAGSDNRCHSHWDLDGSSGFETGRVEKRGTVSQYLWNHGQWHLRSCYRLRRGIEIHSDVVHHPSLSQRSNKPSKPKSPNHVDVVVQEPNDTLSTTAARNSTYVDTSSVKLLWSIN